MKEWVLFASPIFKAPNVTGVSMVTVVLAVMLLVMYAVSPALTGIVPFNQFAPVLHTELLLFVQMPVVAGSYGHEGDDQAIELLQPANRRGCYGGWICFHELTG